MRLRLKRARGQGVHVLFGKLTAQIPRNGVSFFLEMYEIIGEAAGCDIQLCRQAVPTGPRARAGNLPGSLCRGSGAGPVRDGFYQGRIAAADGLRLEAHPAHGRTAPEGEKKKDVLVKIERLKHWLEKGQKMFPWILKFLVR